MLFERLPRLVSLCVLVVAIASCGGDSADGERGEPADGSADAEAGAAAEAPPASTPASDPGATTTAPLTPGDIGRWQKGMAGELEAVRTAAAKLKSAKTSDDTLSAMMAVQEMTTAEAGARAAGVNLERYKVIRSALSAAASYLTPELGGIDTTMLSPEQRTELRQGNEMQLKQMEGQVPAPVVEALRPRAVELRKQDLTLVGERLKAAGMAQ